MNLFPAIDLYDKNEENIKKILKYDKIKKSSKNIFYNSALRNQQRNYESANG